MFEVVSINRSAWVIRKDESVKSSLKVGDVLYQGDQLEVNHNHSVQLAMNEDLTNLIHIQGEAIIKVSRDLEKSIELTRGTVFCLLDNSKANTPFKIKTPLAVAAVRGTQYQVTHYQQSDIITYKGQIKVTGIDALGREIRPAIMLEPNNRTSITPEVRTPSPPVPISEMEAKEFEMIKKLVHDTRDSAKDWAARSRFSENSDDPEDQFIQQRLEKIGEKYQKESQTKKGKGQLVY